MGVNIFGPYGPGINETTVRPDAGADSHTEDTFFAPCIDGDPNTGTKISFRWLNFITANMRRAVRGMGVPENTADDDLLLKAIQKAVSPPAAQVPSDWSQMNPAAVDFIKNKPAIPAAPVQADWNQTLATALDFIRNKPTLGVIGARVFASSGSYVPTAGARNVLVFLTASGASGANDASGGAGETRIGIFPAVPASIVIGSGGTPVAGVSFTGNDGGDSSAFGMTAKGGRAPTTTVSGNVNGGLGGSGGAGGVLGIPGGSGQVSTGPVSYWGNSLAGGSSFWGGSGPGLNSSTSGTSTGASTTPGAGGPGAQNGSVNPAGAGAAGLCLIIEF